MVTGARRGSRGGVRGGKEIRKHQQQGEETMATAIGEKRRIRVRVGV